jgi:hypothetical protein
VAKVHLELQEGWAGEPVEIRVAGSRRYSGRPVTRLQTGFADAVQVDVEGDSLALDVRVPARSIANERVIHVADEHWVGLSLRDDEVRIVDQATPFGYV